MDSSNTTNYQETISSFLNLPQPPPPSIPSPPTSPFNSLPSYLPTFHSTSPPPLQQQPPPPRSSKKRPRASRRAPTTILTTDTSNFRSMVQQFTGFPSPPFTPSSSSSFARPRLDPSSPYILSRPFAQKIPMTSSLFDAIAASAANTSSNNYPFGHNPILAPQFGDLGSLVGMLSRADEQPLQEAEKRQKTLPAEDWIHPSD